MNKKSQLKPVLDNPGHDLRFLRKLRGQMKRDVSSRVYTSLEQSIMRMMWWPGIVNMVNNQKNEKS